MQSQDSETFDFIPDTPKYRVTRAAFVVVCCSVLVALIVTIWKVGRLQMEVADLQTELVKSQASMAREITRIRGLSSMAANTNKQTIKTLREELDQAKAEVHATAGRAREDATQTVQRLEAQLKAEEQRQSEMRDQVAQQLADAHQVAAGANARIADVRSEVGSVKTQMAQAQTSINKAVTDLRRVMGDMGVMSGLIATNQRELDVLKALGDRNYTEFRLPKSKDRRVVNGISITVKKTDPGSKRYTLELVADDQRVQKRDKSVNEPLQFYVANRKQPYEIVVNRVGKDEIVGYLATPKLDAERE